MHRRIRSARATRTYIITAERAQLKGVLTSWPCVERIRGNAGALLTTGCSTGRAVARNTTTGTLGNTRVSAGITREPASITVHAARRIEGSFTRNTHSSSVPLRIRIEE